MKITITVEGATLEPSPDQWQPNPVRHEVEPRSLTVEHDNPDELFAAVETFALGAIVPFGQGKFPLMKKIEAQRDELSRTLADVRDNLAKEKRDHETSEGLSEHREKEVKLWRWRALEAAAVAQEVRKMHAGSGVRAPRGLPARYDAIREWSKDTPEE